MPAWDLFTAPASPPPPLSPSGATFGRSISFGGTFNLDAGGAWLTVEGTQAVVDTVIRRWVSTAGSFSLRPDFGGGAEGAVNAAMSSIRLDALRNRLRSQALDDPRVVDVKVDLQPQVNGELRVSGVLILGGANTSGFDFSLPL